MRAIVQTGYGEPGDVLEVRDLPTPTVGDGEVLLQVHAASVHADVWHVVRGLPHVLRLLGNGMRTPKRLVPGIDAAGVVAEVGSGVTRFGPGDAVFGELVRGHQWKNGGAYAEYVSVPEDRLWPKPDRLSFVEAAAVPTAGKIAVTTMHPEHKVHPGTTVVVVGAAGAVGAFAVQIAKAYGGVVTGVDHTDKLDVVRNLGADDVVDYAQQDYTQLGRTWDLVYDIVGSHPWQAIKPVIAEGGSYVLVGHDHYGEGMNRWFGSVPRMFGLTARSVREPALDLSAPKPSEDPMATLCRLIEEGELTPVIDRTFPLEEAAAALDYLATGRATGKIVLTV